MMCVMMPKITVYKKMQDGFTRGEFVAAADDCYNTVKHVFNDAYAVEFVIKRKDRDDLILSYNNKRVALCQQ